MSHQQTAETRAEISRYMKMRWADPIERAKLMNAAAKRVVQWVPEWDHIVSSLRANGASWRTIAKRIGVSERTLMPHVDRIGLPHHLPHHQYQFSAKHPKVA